MLKRNVLIFIAIIIAVGVFMFFVFKNKQKKAELPPVFSIVGEIAQISGDSFQIKALGVQNGFGKDKDFLVFVASSTVFSNIEMPQTISEENVSQPILAKKAGLFDLKINDNVVVESDINLRNISEFTAKSVQSAKNIEQ